MATKLNTYLEFPMRNLDMRPFLSSLGARWGESVLAL